MLLLYAHHHACPPVLLGGDDALQYFHELACIVDTIVFPRVTGSASFFQILLEVHPLDTSCVQSFSGSAISACSP